LMKLNEKSPLKIACKYLMSWIQNLCTCMVFDL
jgi:hypothetical protein